MMGSSWTPHPPIGGRVDPGDVNDEHVNDETLALLGECELAPDEIRRFASELLADDPSLDAQWHEPALLLAAAHVAGCPLCTSRRAQLLVLSSAALAEALVGSAETSPQQRESALTAALAAFDSMHPSTGAVAADPHRVAPHRDVRSPSTTPWWKRLGASGPRSGTGSSAGTSGGSLALARQRWIVGAVAVAVALGVWFARSDQVSEVGTVALRATSTTSGQGTSDQGTSGQAMPPDAAVAGAPTETAAGSASTVEAVSSEAPGAKRSQEPAPVADQATAGVTVPDTSASSPAATERAPKKLVDPATEEARNQSSGASPTAATPGLLPGAKPQAGAPVPSLAVGDAPSAEVLAVRFDSLTRVPPSPTTSDRSETAGAAASAAQAATAAPAAPQAAAAAAAPPTPVAGSATTPTCPPSGNDELLVLGRGSIAGLTVELRRIRTLVGPDSTTTVVGSPTPEPGVVKTVEFIDVVDLLSCEVLTRHPASS